MPRQTGDDVSWFPPEDPVSDPENDQLKVRLFCYGKASIMHSTTRGTKKCGQLKEEIRRTCPNFYPPQTRNKETRLRDPSNPTIAEGADTYVTTLLGGRRIATCELKRTQLDVPTGLPGDKTTGDKFVSSIVLIFHILTTSRTIIAMMARRLPRLQGEP